MRCTVFEVSGKVLGKARHRFRRTGGTYTPATTRMYEGAVRRAYIAAGGEMIDGAVHIDFEAVTGIQKSATKKQQAARLMGDELSLKKPDIDNIEKIVLDALNGVAYADDSSVVSVRKIKGRYETTPRLIVRVREVEPSELLAMHSFLWADHA